MIALCIVGGILLLLALLFFFGTVKVRFLYREHPKIRASVCGIRFSLYGDDLPEKPDLTKCKNPQKALKLEMKYQKKYLAKLKKKQKKEAAKKAAHAAETAPKKKSPGEILAFVKMIFRLLKKLYAETKGKIRIRCFRLHIRIATDDAAKTALLYGATVSATSALLGWVDENFNRIRRNPGDMTIEPDYTTDQSSADVDISLGIRLFRAVPAGLRMLRAYRREKAIQAKGQKQIEK